MRVGFYHIAMVLLVDTGACVKRHYRGVPIAGLLSCLLKQLASMRCNAGANMEGRV